MAGIRGFVQGLALAFLAVSPAFPAESLCGSLCGRWHYDEAASDPVEAKLDAVLASYKEPKDLGGPDSPIGSFTDRPGGKELRAQFLSRLQPPRTLQFTVAGPDVLIGADDRAARRLSPGVPHSRVDSFGTARIQTVLKPGRLSVSERYDSRNETTETYAVEARTGLLVVTLDVRRPGLKALRLRSVYRPG